MLIWDITKDDPSVLYRGRAADRLELDRLLKRMEKLVGDRRDLETQLQKVNQEIASINERLDELQR
jgi:predicted  nucleic acid-binding Zn-ribbon protein